MAERTSSSPTRSKLNYQYPREHIEQIQNWLSKKLPRRRSKIGEEEFLELEAKQKFLSLVWFHFCTAWAKWCKIVREKAQQDPGRLRGIPIPLIARSEVKDYTKDFPYYDESSNAFGPSIPTQKRFFQCALRDGGFPLLDPFVLRPYLETLIIYYNFIAAEMPSSLTTRIDSAFIQIAWQAGYYTRAINEELAKWERTASSNIVRQTEAEKRREAIMAFVFGNPRLRTMSQRSLAEYIHKNFPWGRLKRVTVPQLRKDLTKVL